MMLSEALHTLLVDDAGVTAAIGDRLYPRRLPQGPTYPAAVYALVDGEPMHSQDGPSGLRRQLVEIRTFGKTDADAEAAARAIESKLDGFKGLVGSIDLNGVFNNGESNDYDDDLEVYFWSIDYLVLYNPPAP